MKAVPERLNEAISAYTQEHLGEIHLELFPQFVESGDIAMVEHILRECPLESPAESVRMAPLVVASQAGNLEMIDLLLKHKDLPQVAAKMDEALKVAFDSGYKEIMRVLIQAGADQRFSLGDCKYYYLSTLLIEAVARADLDMVKTLLELGAEVNVVGEAEYPSEPFGGSFTALRNAVIGGQLEMIRVLLEARADPNLKEPLFDAINNGDRDVVKLLIKHGALIEMHRASENDDRVSSALIHACECATTEMVQLLMDEGADVNAIDYRGDTALSYAAKFGRTEVVRALIGKGADVNAVNDEQCTALTYPLLLGREEISTALLENGANRAQAEKVLQVACVKRSMIETLLHECSDTHYSSEFPFHYGTILCADCNWKSTCDELMSQEQDVSP